MGLNPATVNGAAEPNRTVCAPRAASFSALVPSNSCAFVGVPVDSEEEIRAEFGVLYTDGAPVKTGVTSNAPTSQPCPTGRWTPR